MHSYLIKLNASARDCLNTREFRLNESIYRAFELNSATIFTENYHVHTLRDYFPTTDEKNQKSREILIRVC